MACEIGYLALKPAHGGGGQGNVGGHTGIRHGKAGGEIVAAVQHQCGACDQCGGIVGRDAGLMVGDGDLGVKARDPIGGGLRLGRADVGLGKDRLALQVAGHGRQCL